MTPTRRRAMPTLTYAVTKDKMDLRSKALAANKEELP